MFNRQFWEIPGGHRESGEKNDETAKRKVFEETLAFIIDY
ncbi:NUDIX domain-containing protein [Lysinibacillus sp. FJAT-14745]